MPPSSSIELPGLPPLAILHEDSRCLAVDKPPGVACTAADAAPGGPNLESLFESAIAANAPWATEREIRSLRLVRPLDPEIGGLLLLTRAPGSRLAFARAVEERRSIAQFLAVIGGKPPKRRWTSCLKIRPDPDAPDRVLTHTRQGQYAETDFEVIGHGEGMALVLARPRTARRHQIRAHLAASGVPILGDTDYGFGRRAPIKQHGALPRTESPGLRGHAVPLALRAVRLAFECPFRREPLDMSAPVDEFLADYGFHLETEVWEEDPGMSEEPSSH